VAASPVSYGTHFFHSSAAGSSHAPRGPPTTSPRTLKCSWSGSVAGCHLVTAHPYDFFVIVTCFLSLGPRRLAGKSFSTVPVSIAVPVLPDGAGDACRGPSLAGSPELVFTVFLGSSMTGSKSPSEMICKRGIAPGRIKLPLAGGWSRSEQLLFHSSFPNLFQASRAQASTPWEKRILLVTSCKTRQNRLLGGRKGPNTQKDEDAEGKTRAPKCIKSGLQRLSCMRLRANTFSRLSNLKY
jgi:hypothetical protein